MILRTKVIVAVELIQGLAYPAPDLELVTQFDHKDARSAPESTGRSGRYKTTMRCCWQAPRFLGGQQFAPSSIKLSHPSPEGCFRSRANMAIIAM